MKNLSIFTWVSALLLTFVIGTTSIGCKGAKDTVKNSATNTINGSFAAKKKSLLWKVTGNKLKKPSYVFGTIHMIPEKDFFMPSHVKDVFSKVDKVFFEINTEDMGDMSMMTTLMDMIFMEDGVTLKDLLNEEDYKKVKSKLAENPMMMMMGDMADRIKPMFLSSMMEQGDMGGGSGGGSNPFGGMGGMGASGMKSYELELTSMANELKKPIGGLETIEFQMSMFDSIPLKEQAEMLVQAINTSKEEGEDVIGQMVEMYKDQDIPGLFSMIREQSKGSSEFEDKFLTMRNKNWIPQMKEMMPVSSVFYAVGAGHLGGENGVISLLRQEGYTVTPITK